MVETQKILPAPTPVLNTQEGTAYSLLALHWLYIPSPFHGDLHMLATRLGGHRRLGRASEKYLHFVVTHKGEQLIWRDRKRPMKCPKNGQIE